MSDKSLMAATMSLMQDVEKIHMGATGQKNVPCPVGFTLSLVDGTLNSAMLIRSSDSRLTYWAR